MPADTKIMLGCEAMAHRLAQGAPPAIRSVSDIEPTSGLMIAHGHLPPAVVRDELITRDLAGYVLFGVHFLGCTFSAVSLRSADLRGASLVGCTFEGCNLEDADLAGVYIHGCQLRVCDFTGARLVGAEVSRSEIIDCTGWPQGPDAYRNTLRA